VRQAPVRVRAACFAWGVPDGDTLSSRSRGCLLRPQAGPPVEPLRRHPRMVTPVPCVAAGAAVRLAPLLLRAHPAAPAGVSLLLNRCPLQYVEAVGGQACSGSSLQREFPPPHMSCRSCVHGFTGIACKRSGEGTLLPGGVALCCCTCLHSCAVCSSWQHPPTNNTCCMRIGSPLCRWYV
jgi:hypothetical protein